MEETINNQTPATKIYKDNAIYVGTFIGGPLFAGYLIAENFKAFDEYGRAKKTWFFSIIFTILIFGGVFLIPDDVKIPNQIIPIIYTGITGYLVKHFQGKNIETHINSGGELFSWRRTIGVGIVGLALIILALCAIVILTEKATTTETTKTFGVMKHEIAYDKDNIEEIEVDKLADGLVKTMFFDEAITKYVYVKKINSSFQISISCDKSVTNSAETEEPFVQLRKELQVLFPDNEIVFNLVVGDLDNIVKRIE